MPGADCPSRTEHVGWFSALPLLREGHPHRAACTRVTHTGPPAQGHPHRASVETRPAPGAPAQDARAHHAP